MKKVELIVEFCEECPFYRYHDGGRNSSDYEYCCNEKIVGSSCIEDSNKILINCPLLEPTPQGGEVVK